MSVGSDRLAGKVAFITGAARGQGRAHAVRMAEEGADIIGVDLCDQLDSVGYAMATEQDLAATERLVEDRDRRILASRVDVRDRGGLQHALERGVAELGRVDIAVANAGIAPLVGDVDHQQAWYDAIDVLLTGVYHTVDLAGRSMVAQGHGGAIVITSSLAGLGGYGSLPVEASSPGWVGYIAAKHGVVGVMRHYAALLAPHEIRVNSVHPTGVNTPMIDNEHIREFFAGFTDPTSLQNALPVTMIEPEDISNAIVWLCSDQARYVTGVTLPVDAGALLR